MAENLLFNSIKKDEEEKKEKIEKKEKDAQ